MRDYVDHIYNEIQAEIDRRFSNQEKAIDIAQTGLEQRLKSMNEFRGVISDLVSKNVTRETFDHHVDSTREIFDHHVNDTREAFSNRASEIIDRLSQTELRVDRIETVTKETEMTRSANQNRLTTRVMVTGILVSGILVIGQILVALVAAHVI